MVWVAVALIRAYQWAFSWRPSSCRFHPTCSQYTLDALVEHGAARGGWLGVRRISRCHPWNEGGLDPVPPVRARSRSGRAADDARLRESGLRT
ncbi:MAG: membrane protein insertion efficiency factor YidD [Acidimicrobiia bacterium]|nr:membrane protein insertion efficiency factor YidD [Acidimicrobiia bacterium]MCL4292062.1 membrane protein insertion efficiency factor YidD [Acidimicrobiia bacterium]